MSNLLEATSTGTAVPTPSVLHSVVLTAGSDAASIVLRDASGGPALLTLKAAANASAVWQSSKGVFFGTEIHTTFTGTSPLAYIEYS